MQLQKQALLTHNRVQHLTAPVSVDYPVLAYRPAAAEQAKLPICTTARLLRISVSAHLKPARIVFTASGGAAAAAASDGPSNA